MKNEKRKSLITEIQEMQIQLTGMSYPDWELEQMSDRSLNDLHAEMWSRYDEDMRDNQMMFFE